MLFYWGESIPFISAPDSYGAFWYLGPYFNIMPVVAVTLMIFQQKYTMPPPTDEQQEMQQKMMKYMMVFMGLMFYKVPSGLVLYFIASSIWGFCERKLLPKKKKPAADGTVAEPQPGFLQNLLNKPAAKDSTGIVTAPSPSSSAVTNGSPRTEGKGRNRGKQGKNKRKNGPGPTVDSAAPAAAAGGSIIQRIIGWWRGRRERMNEFWTKVQEEAQKKNRL
jgi:membrane protein insertase Oxa1/YidC/SpoIIIJ